MDYKLFDVVELKDGNKATIVNIDENIYRVVVTNKNGINTDTKEIESKDISKVVFSKEIN